MAAPISGTYVPQPGRPRGLPAVSIIVPTLREADNLPELARRVGQVRRRHGLEAELLLVDDDSGDGIAEVAAGLQLPWLRVLRRTGRRDLSQAVLAGLRQARHETLVVMDADLSHPPEAIPRMLRRLQEGCDFVLGSRYVPGGSTDERWGPLRRVMSRGATLMARPFTAVRDPLSGFFALRRSTLQAAPALRPIGYKIGLELLVKCRCRRVAEVPIHFADRRAGRTKLTARQQLRHLRHLLRLLRHQYLR